MNLNYYDPATPNHYKYDINHLCAVANALLYELGDSEESGMDILTNLYSGWGGDMLSFAIDVKEAENNGVTDIEEWAKDNICQSNLILCFQVILDCLMIIQVITRQIGKDTSCELQSADTLLCDRVRTDLHKGILASFIRHFSQ